MDDDDDDDDDELMKWWIGELMIMMFRFNGLRGKTWWDPNLYPLFCFSYLDILG